MGEQGRSIQRHRRVGLCAKVRVTTLDPEVDPATGKPYFRVSEETCANVSLGGVFLATHQPIASGCRLMLELELPEGQRVETLGRVVWSRTALRRRGLPVKDPESGLGVEFVAAAPEQLAVLERYLARSLPRSRKAPAARPRPHTGTTL